jgi:hypothetical protein
MSKNRFNDTGMWKKAWFRNLDPVAKCFWEFLIDHCDHAGIWDIDEGTLKHHIDPNGPFEIKLEPLLSLPAFTERIQKVGKEKLYIPGFVTYQYKITSLDQLNPNNKVHKSVIERLKSLSLLSPMLAPTKGHTEEPQAPSNGATETDTDTAIETETARAEIEKIFSDVFPKKEGLTFGVALLLPEITTSNALISLRSAATKYAQISRTKPVDQVKNFESFAKCWKDYTLPNAGQVVYSTPQNRATQEIQEQFENYSHESSADALASIDPNSLNPEARKFLDSINSKKVGGENVLN